MALSPLVETTETLAKLVGAPTVSSDPNMELIWYLADRLDSVGARIEVMRDESGSKANLWATLGPEVSGGIVLSGHTDVVPVAEQAWSSDPFDMVEHDGLLYGRGTCDMKGFIAACMTVAPALAAAAQNRPVHFAFTHDEETGCIGAGNLISILKDREIRPKLAIIGEPTEMRIIEGHKGCCEYTVDFQGLEGHGSSPDLGVNAVEYASLYIARLLDLRERLKSRAPATSPFEPPWTTINIGGLHGGVAHNVIASRARLDWEMRPVNAADGDFVRDELRRYVSETLLPRMRSIYPDAEITTQIIGEIVGLEPVSDNAARALVGELTGGNSVGTVPFGTEAGLFQALGMDAVVCGPGSIAQAHKADEFLALDQLQSCLDMLGGLTRHL